MNLGSQVFDYILRLTVSVFPVLLFLLALNLIDSYKLVRPRSMIRAMIVGVLVALVCLLVYVLIMRVIAIRPVTYVRYAAPLVEELLKAIYVVYLIRSRKIGFLVDAAILGFAVGAGFAIVENVYYFNALGDPRVVIWIVRGFGTAIMHGGITAIFGILSKSLCDRGEAKGTLAFVPGLVIAVLVHSFYNHFFLNPVVSTVLVHVTLPLVFLVVFYRSEQATRQWLGSQFDVDQEMLDIINSGRVSDSRLGVFFASIRESFRPEVVVDMLCYLRLHVELAINAKGLLLMREAGFDPQPTPDIREKFAELKHLEKSIGRTGQLAIHPLIHTSSRELWQLHMLGKH
ncbi:MAG: PrsW family intramembrane metalloprotease [Candidatus Krumholzibacteria bacterium]|nr:PrsW family intramembrane metalloprotease [Candidatus Krumholzibacteria bacterium]